MSEGVAVRSDTTPAGHRDLTAVWDQTRTRIAALVGGLADSAADVTVPTVPGVTVRDVLAHLVHSAAKAGETPREVCGGSIAPPRAGGAEPDAKLTDILAAWKGVAAIARRQVQADLELASFLITDAVMCEHDLRTTFDVPAARDDIAIKVALDELSGRFCDRAEAAGLPPLRVTVEQWGTIIGNGWAISCVVADRFEFVRAMSGRRSAPEIRQWNWGVEPDIYFSAMSEVPIPSHEIHERDPRIPEHMRDREFVL